MCAWAQCRPSNSFVGWRRAAGEFFYTSHRPVLKGDGRLTTIAGPAGSEHVRFTRSIVQNQLQIGHARFTRFGL